MSGCDPREVGRHDETHTNRHIELELRRNSKVDLEEIQIGYRYFNKFPMKHIAPFLSVFDWTEAALMKIVISLKRNTSRI